MRKLFSILGSFVLCVLVWLLGLFIYPVSFHVAATGILASLAFLATADATFRYLIVGSVLRQKDEFEIPLWYSACFNTLLILLAVAVYAGYQMKAANPYAAGVVAWRFISTVLLGTAMISFLHRKMLEADLFRVWRRGQFVDSVSESAEADPLEQSKQQV